MKQTALTSIDSYKLGHGEMYPDGTTKVYSNFTPRSMSHFNVPDEYKADKKIVWFGLQGFLHELNSVWKETFFDLPEDEVTNEFNEFVAPFCGPNGFNIERVRELHRIGYLPLEIKSLSEGVRVPIGVPVLTITNTVASAFWLPNFLETWLSSELWKSSTSATMARVYRKIIDSYADLTGGSKEFVTWQGHDFSIRGMSGIADAAKSGAGHLLSFTGTDNLPAVKYVNDYYNGKSTFVGGSVPASEHSVMSSSSRDAELDTYRYILSKYPSGVVSLVSDTYDFFQVITTYAKILKDDILNRVPDSLGLAKVVFRPDSGDPVKIITGDPDAPVGSPEHKGAVECLWEIFGGTVNDKGYKTLNQRVGLIYGDSITVPRCEAILVKLAAKGFASDNIVFGIGSYTYQFATRDSLGFAMKATHRVTNGEGVAIFKDPKTDNGTKKSAKGLLCVHKSPLSGDYILVDGVTVEGERSGELKTVFLDGKILVNDSIETIRARVSAE
jgi:nicotinamide phosphoribosyltransferase